jgi:hypothetical protein
VSHIESRIIKQDPQLITYGRRTDVKVYTVLWRRAKVVFGLIVGWPEIAFRRILRYRGGRQVARVSKSPGYDTTPIQEDATVSSENGGCGQSDP